MIIIKLLFLFISIGVSAFCIVKINALPDKELSFKENDKKISCYMYISGTVDFIFFIFIGIIASPIALDDSDAVLMIILSVVWFGVAIVTARKLRQRIREYVNDKKFYYSMKLFVQIVFIKIMFFMIEIGWLME